MERDQNNQVSHINPESISILSTLVNFVLGLLKIVFGILINSAALTADGVHSGIDVISSFITFLGIRTAKKPPNEKYPYGRQKAESLSGLFVSLLLGITGISILYESIKRFSGEQPTLFSWSAIAVILIAIIATELMARLKFVYGRKYKSLALLADAEHSRADVLSSIGVLVGLSLIKYFQLGDAIVALLIGLYILWEAFGIGKEVTESFLDVSDKDVEERIKKICQAHNIEIVELKTRKIGENAFAEMKIKLPADLKVGEAQRIVDALEERLTRNILELKQLVISIESYDITKNVVLTDFGEKIGECENIEKIGPKKRGTRIVGPLDGSQKYINPIFGTKYYFMIDYKDNRILNDKIIKNPYFQNGTAHGTHVVKALRADQALAVGIGQNAIESLKNYNIDVYRVPQNTSVDEIRELIRNSQISDFLNKNNNINSK